jgi:hypothetical protein
VAAAAMAMSEPQLHLGTYVMCLDLSPDCQYIRAAVFPRHDAAIEPRLTVDVLAPPGDAADKAKKP